MGASRRTEADIGALTAFPGWPGITLHRLGNAILLHSEPSGALVLAQEAAIGLAAAGLTAEAAGQDAPPEARALVAEWQAAGLFLDRRLPFPDAVDWRPAEAAPLVLAEAGRRVVLRCEPPDLSRDLALALDPLAPGPSAAGPDGPASVSAASSVTDSAPDFAPDSDTAAVDILSLPGGYGIFRDRVATWGRAGPEVARHRALREVLIGLAGPARVGAVLHAAAVARGGRALVIAGDTGAGKSTLALTLARAGWAHLADDLAVLDRAGRLRAAPLRISLRAGSWALAAPEALAGAPVRRGAGGEMLSRYVSPPGAAPAGTVAPVGAVLFPSYVPGAAAGMTALPPEEAFVRLISCGGRLAGDPDCAAGLVAMLNRAPAVALIHGGGGDVPEICAALLDGAGP